MARMTITFEDGILGEILVDITGSDGDKPMTQWTDAQICGHVAVKAARDFLKEADDTFTETRFM